MVHYPIYLDLRDRLCIVGGGGPAMEQKVGGLLRSNADVRVVAERVTPGLRRLVHEGRIEDVCRAVRIR